MEQLKIGQPLTLSQVRDLPDGAVIDAVHSTYTPDRLVRIAGEWRYHAGGWCGINNRKGWVYDNWKSATLVSLPPIEPKANDNLIYEKLAQSPETAIDTSPAPVAEIEKEAALALLAGKLQELQALGARDYVCRVVDNYRAAVAYAKSKGAL